MKIGYLGATQTKQSLEKVMAYYRYIHFGRKVLNSNYWMRGNVFIYNSYK